MHKVFTRSLVVVALCAGAVSASLAETAASPPNGGSADLFEPFNQKECDYPSPCGCGCNPKTAAPPGAGAAPAAPSRRN